MAEHSVAPSGLMLASVFAGVSPLPVIISALRASAALPFAKMCIKSSYRGGGGLHESYICVTFAKSSETRGFTAEASDSLQITCYILLLNDKNSFGYIQLFLFI